MRNRGRNYSRKSNKSYPNRSTKSKSGSWNSNYTYKKSRGFGRYRKKSSTASLPTPAIVGLGIIALGWSVVQSNSQLVSVTNIVLVLAIVVVCAAVIYKVYISKFWKRYKALSVSQIDAMDGFEFENYLQAILKSRGFQKVQVTQQEGDFGADVIAEFNTKKIAIQAKRYAQHNVVGIDAVYQILGGMKYYDCEIGAVVTTSSFTPQALTLAKKSNVEMIDRSRLLDWIAEYHNS